VDQYCGSNPASVSRDNWKSEGHLGNSCTYVPPQFLPGQQKLFVWRVMWLEVVLTKHCTNSKCLLLLSCAISGSLRKALIGEAGGIVGLSGMLLRGWSWNPSCYSSSWTSTSANCKIINWQYNPIQILIEPDLCYVWSHNTILNINSKRTEKLLNNANSWVLPTSRCNHDVKFIVVFGKDSKSLIYYITKTSIYIAHMYSLLQIAVQNNFFFLKRQTYMMLFTKVIIWSYDVWIQLEVNKKYWSLKQLVNC
jgi:hypothetical protein